VKSILIAILFLSSFSSYARYYFLSEDDVLKPSSKRFWDHTRASVLGFSKILTPGSKISFNNDVNFTVQELNNIWGGIRFSGLSTGSNRNRRYYFSCILKLTKSTEDRVIRRGKQLTIKDVTYGIPKVAGAILWS
jgi:hypothetical protein